MNAPQAPDAPKAIPPRRWVWHCTEDSIAAGQISLLALAETLAAVALYWWLSFHFEWHWFSLVSLIAAPMLLLRSEESVELGVEMLRRWTGRKGSDWSRWEKAVMVLSTALVGGWIAYCLAQAWLPGQVGWALYWRAGMIGMIAAMGTVVIVVAVADAVAFAAAVAVANAVDGAVADAVAVVDVGAFAFAFAFAGAFAVMGTVAVGGTVASASVRGISSLLVGSAFALGALLRALTIRWKASLCHLSRGLRCLPHNWRENLLVVDLGHPPELLPQAGSVCKDFTVAGLWHRMADETGSDQVVTAILIAAWYLPALAYRWSLKASAWFLWPLALALTPPFQGMDGYARRERAAVVSRGAWAFPLLLPLTLLVWLLLSLWPELKEWLVLLWPTAAETTQKLLGLLKPPPLGLRYGLLWLVVLLALALAWRRKNLLAAYDKVLGSPKGYSELSEQEREEFESRASGVERLRLWMIVALFLFGEAFALDFIRARNPTEIEHLIWPWLLVWI